MSFEGYLATSEPGTSIQGSIAAWLFATTSLLGIPGNILVIIAVALSQQLHTSTNIFVVALAIIDLLNCLLLPIQVVSLLGNIESVAFDWACRIFAVLMYIFLGISVSTLTLIAYNRFYMITRTKRDYDRIFTTGNIRAMFFGVGGAITLMTVVFAATGIATFGHYEGICAHVEGKTYTYISGLWLLVSLIVIIVCYIKIYKHVKRHLRNVASMNESLADATTHASADHSPQVTGEGGKSKLVGSRFPERHRKLESKITTNMLIIIVLFFICVSPSILTLIIPGDQEESAIIVAIIAFNSCLNPLVYAWKHPVFRDVFKCILCRRIAHIKEPSRWARTLQGPARVDKVVETEMHCSDIT